MASKRFGSGYYDDWESMVVGMKKGLQKAFNEACDELCERGNEIIRGAIYSNNMGETYDDFRTYEMGAIDYLQAHVNGLDCYFTLDNKEILSLKPSNPPHHALTDEGKNGYDAESFMINIIETHNEKNFLEPLRDLIQKEFPKIYRERCRKNGLEL